MARQNLLCSIDAMFGRRANFCGRSSARALRRAILEWSTITSIAALALFCGCRTAHYTAAKLPPHLEVPPAPPPLTINLANVAGRGGGTSLIATGDLVEITIASGLETERVHPITARVTQDGTVLVPLVGPVSIRSLDPVGAEKRIAAAAIERDVFRQPYVTVRIAERAVNRITVLGAVAKPGVVELARGSSDLISALAAAGGLAKDAGTKVDVLCHDSLAIAAGQANHSGDGPRNDVEFARHTVDGLPAKALGFAAPTLADGSESSANNNGHMAATQLSPPRTTRIDLAQMNQIAGVNHELADQDVVMVLPEEKQVIHVTGLVVRPNQFEVSPKRDVRLLDAVAMAGGVKSPLADKVLVIRQRPEMQEPAIIRASLAEAKRDGRENLRLAPGDLVSVEATPTTLVFDTATNFFRVAIGLSGNIMSF